MSQAKLQAIDTAIAKLQAKREALVIALANNLTAEKLVPGAVVEFSSGRGEAKVTESGTVLAVIVNPKGGTVVRVFVNAGADSRVASPFMSQIIRVVGDSEPASAE